jgi:hypothetical protein
MPRYRIRFYEEVGGWIYFQADTKEDAEQIFDGLQSGEIWDDEPMFEKSTKHSQTTLEELEETDNA